MAITLQRLCEKASYLYGLRVLAGAPGMNSPVQWVHVVERVSSWMNTPPFRYFRPQKLPQYRQAGYSQCSKAFYSH